MKKIISIILLVTLVFSGISVYASENAIYVSKSGSDTTGDGSEGNPYYSIEKAKEEASKASSATVYIEEGVYNVSDMLFSSADSNTSYEGIGNVVITEAKDINVSEFSVVKNPDILKKLRPEVWGNVYELKLSQYNADITDAALYIDGKKMNIARYPNRADKDSYYGITRENRYMIASNLVASDGNTSFTVSDDRASAWQEVDTEDAYILGSVVATYDWRKRDILSINNKTITVSGSIRNKTKFCICNIIEEIDVTGEYVYDSDKKMIYVYLPKDINTASVVLKSTADSLITVKGAVGLSFKNIKFDKISKSIFSTENSNGLSITNCEFNYIDARVLTINGKNMTVDSNKVYGCKSGFVKFSGGEVTRDEFVYGKVRISNNLISNCGNEEYRNYMIQCGTNSPADVADSVGNEIVNNVIYNCGGIGAIGPSGIELTVRNNEIFNVARHIHDGGAVYMGRSNMKVGTVISNNYVHHLNTDLSYAGLYSDDGQGGMTMKNNVLYDMRSGILVGAGMNGNFSDNMCIENIKALGLGSRMSGNGVYAEKNSVDEDGYASEEDGKKVYTMYAETKKALENYPGAYADYTDLSQNALTRTPFFAPWNTKINGNVHYTKNENAVLGDKNDKKTADNEVVTELRSYNGEFSYNTQIGYSESDFENFDAQDFTLKTSAPSGSNIGAIDMNTIGLTNTTAYSKDNTFDFTPMYNDGELKIVFNKSKNASKYVISLKNVEDEEDEYKEEYFDDNSDTAYETKHVTPGETYEITVEAINLAKQNQGSETLKKTYKIPAENDKTALNYIANLLKNEVEKEAKGKYEYSDTDVVTRMNTVLKNANTLIANESATASAISDMENDILNALSDAQKYRKILEATISEPEVSSTEAKVTVKAEDFEPYSYVTIAVTNPSYVKGDIINNTAEAVVRYADVKRASSSGEIEFIFDTAVNGIDMPDRYNVYLVGENGIEVSGSYYYGTIETSAVKFAKGNEAVSKDDLKNYPGETFSVSLDVNNRMNSDIDSVVYCGIYDNNRLIGLASVDYKKLEMNKVNEISFELEIPLSFTENSTVEIMIFDKDTFIKPLTVKKSITELK